MNDVAYFCPEHGWRLATFLNARVWCACGQECAPTDTTPAQHAAAYRGGRKTPRGTPADLRKREPVMGGWHPSAVPSITTPNDPPRGPGRPRLAIGGKCGRGHAMTAGTLGLSGDRSRAWCKVCRRERLRAAA